MTPEQFIAKWQANTRSEAAASKEHFLDLCALLGVETPNSDPTGAAYAFEKGARKAAGGAGWADVWRRGCFGWEYKSRGGDLDAAHDQLLRHAGALENPPLLVTSDMERIVVRTNWTNAVSERHSFALADLRDAMVRARLAACWSDPDRWRPATTRQAVTQPAAGEGGIAQGPQAARRQDRAAAPGTAERRAFLDRLRGFRVLDPACGSGNFVYRVLRALKDLEHRAMVEAEAIRLQPEFRQVGPEAVLTPDGTPAA